MNARDLYLRGGRMIACTTLMLFGLAGTAAASEPATICAGADAADCKQALSLAYAADMSASIETTNSQAPDVPGILAKRLTCLWDKEATLSSNWTEKMVWGPAFLMKQGVPAKQQPKIKKLACKDIPKTVVDMTRWTPANTAFVSNSKHDPHTYAVAIAGTNAASIFDAQVEDGDINPVAWPPKMVSEGGGAPKLAPCHKPKDNPCITAGTATGLLNLLALNPKSQGTGTQTLETYLKAFPNDAGTTVTVTGHSLGGALAPALGAWLKEQKPKLNVVIYAFAGATPGGKNFASHVKSLFSQPGTYNALNNQHDVVPHAWSPKTLGQLKTLYEAGAGFKAGIITGCLIDKQYKRALGVELKTLGTFKFTTTETASVAVPLISKDLMRVTNVKLPTASSVIADSYCPLLKGVYSDKKIDGAFDPTYYLTEAAYQHVCGYPINAGLLTLNRSVDSCIKANP